MNIIKRFLIIGVGLYVVLFSAVSYAWEQGIYITQSTIENKKSLNYLIAKSKQVGINTFVIDFKHLSSAYKKNIELVKKNNIKYVARIVIFPHGGTYAQVRSKAYWAQKYQLAEQAIALGAQEIQLDYIRYSSATRASKQNALDIYQIIKWFKRNLAARNIPLQIDVFGETSFDDSMHIGQDVKLFADSIDALCPMVYPSHYEPYRTYAVRPYFIVLSSLQALRAQLGGHLPFKLYPYIELYNYRYPMSRAQKLNYIHEQLRAVADSGADGWYAWSPTNKYNNLFMVLLDKNKL